MTEKDLPALSIADLQSLLRRREVSAREVVDALRARIEAVDGEIGAYLSLDMDAAAKEGRGGECRSSAGRHPGCDQRHHQCDGSAVHLWLKDFAWLSGDLRCDGHSKNCAPRALFHLAKPTWTSLPWVRPRRILP